MNALSLMTVGLVLSLMFVQSGCDGKSESTSSISPQKVVETPEDLILSLESLIDRLVVKDKQDLEEAHKKGKSEIVGMVDGKWWMENGQLARAVYLRGISDIVIALGSINALTSDARDNQKEALNLEYQVGSDSFSGPPEAESKFSGRIEQVVSGKTFGDLADAVTKFYRDKPLFKDKPVLWILAVPLYRELQEAKPQEKKSTYYDKVEIHMLKKQLSTTVK